MTLFLGKREPPKPRSKLCEDCGKVFHSLSGIYHHIKTTHEAPGSFPCDKCDRIFDHKNALAGHKKNVHNKLPCTFCGKLFPGYRLKVHINAVHTEEHLKPFLCQVCQKGFATEGRLNDHMNIHTGNRPHVSILVKVGAKILAKPISYNYFNYRSVNIVAEDLLTMETCECMKKLRMKDTKGLRKVPKQ